VAERLSRAGHQVILLERDNVGAHASSAAAGLLAPVSGRTGDDLATRSMVMFPELVARIEKDSGIEVEFRQLESLAPAFTEADEAQLRGLPGRWLDAAAALAEEPGLNPGLRGAALSASAHLTPPRFVHALARTAVRTGADVREGTPVAGISVSGGQVTGVRLADGVLGSDVVVLAAGPWSAGVVAELELAIDVQPNRGQLVLLRPRRPEIRRIVTRAEGYLVPKPDGSIVAGSTEERAGFDARPTVEGVAGLLEFAREAVPGLAGAVLERAWAALRPATPDGKPLIGPAPGLPNLILATGHNRYGIMLAPITADLVASAIG
jgi:glycine oxidase